MENEEKKVVERPLMNEQEFREYMEKNRVLLTFEGVRKFKSVRRAIRRGHVSLDGIIYPKRPFNNRANTSRRKGHHSRVVNEEKKVIYGQIMHRQSA